MVLYRRNRIPGGTYFFTVTLRDRESTLLVDQNDQLRASFRAIKDRHVTRVRDWPYSMFHRYVRLGVYPRDRAGENMVVAGDE